MTMRRRTCALKQVGDILRRSACWQQHRKPTVRNVHLFAALMLGVQICGASAQQLNGPHMSIVPDRRSNCSGILELESLQVNPPTGTSLIYPSDTTLALDYNAVISWLQGFISARNVLVNDDTSGPVRMKQWMKWLFSYCRANPNKTLVDAALQLSDALRQQ
jgi:hypothetical protein